MINNICMSGQLVAPARIVNTEGISFSVVTIVVELNQKKRFINVLVFDEHIRKIVDKYLIEQNKGKRLCVCGKVSFDKGDKLQIVAYEISFIDKFVDQVTIQENKIEFAENETP